jgi:hypothetical protein
LTWTLACAPTGTRHEAFQPVFHLPPVHVDPDTSRDGGPAWERPWVAPSLYVGLEECDYYDCYLAEVHPMNKFVVMATWDDVPHLSAKQKAELLASIPPFQRDARSKGIPQLGAGAILPIPEDDYKVLDFPVPAHWFKNFGMDVGWNWTAAAHIAHDRDTDVMYVYRTYKRGEVEPTVHAKAIKAPGDWIPGAIDPAANGRSQVDGKKVIDIYLDEGLNLVNANNAVEAGLLEMWQRLATGRLKVFASCSDWFAEARLSRRDEKGKVVKKNDHLMDATRYAIMGALEIATNLAPVKDNDDDGTPGLYMPSSNSWMGA